MKKFKHLFYPLIILALVSCTNAMIKPIEDNLRDGLYEEQVGGHALYYEPWMDECATYKTTAQLVAERVSYSIYQEEIWKSPQTTLRDTYGDCEDFAILFINAYYYGTGEKLGLVLVQSRQVVEGGSINHAMPYDGRPIDQYTGRVEDIPIGYKYSFKEIFG